MAVDGSTIVVGAYNAGTGGAVYVFRTTESSTYTTWRDCYAYYVSPEVVTYNQIAKLTPADAAAYSNIAGISVAIAGDTIVVGGGDGPITNIRRRRTDPPPHSPTRAFTTRSLCRKPPDGAAEDGTKVSRHLRVNN